MFGSEPQPDRATTRRSGSPSIDYELDVQFVVDTADRMKALGDPLRLLIVDLVLERAMSVTELAEIVGRPRGSVNPGLSSDNERWNATQPERKPAPPAGE